MGGGEREGGQETERRAVEDRQDKKRVLDKRRGRMRGI